MPWKFRALSLMDETFQFGVHPGSSRDAGQKLSESQHMFRRIHIQFHLVIDHPDESESRLSPAGLDFTKAAKDPSVRIPLKSFPDHVQ